MAMLSKVFHMGETLFSHEEHMPKIRLSPEDRKVLHQIQSTHSPDASLIVDEAAVLTIAQDILHNASPTSHMDLKTTLALEDKVHQGIPEALAFTIHKIGCEMSCTCSGEGDVRAITLAVFNTLVKYPWDSKIALALSAFAAIYGEFCLLSQLHASNQLAKYINLLKPLPDVSEQESLISALLKVIIDVAKCIIELMELPSQHLSHDKPPLSEALTHMPLAVYLAIKSIVTCSVQSIGLINAGHEYGISNIVARKKLTDLAQTMKSIHVHLTNHLALCHKQIDDLLSNQLYYILLDLMETTRHDNMGFLTQLFHTEDALPLFNGESKRRVSLNVLKAKTVVLFISHPDISDEEIKEIAVMGGRPEREYEIVWLPITDQPIQSNEIKNEIHRKASLMPWYSLHYSLMLHPAVVRFIKEVWHFEKKPLLVVLNAQGKVVCSNAYHMMMIWGSEAFPFDAHREETLWKKVKWNLAFLVDGIDSGKEQWVKEGRHICFYGGEDLDWIRKFTSTMKDVARGGVALEMIYVGKKHTETIIKENLSKFWNPLKIRRFRARLESIWYSKMQHGHSIHTDVIMRQVTMVLSSEGSGEGWTMLGHGSNDMLAVNGKIIIDCLLHLKKVRVSITSENFFSTLTAVIREVISVGITSQGVAVRKHCNHIIVPSTIGVIQKNMVCIDCDRPMEKYVMYKCCVE